MEQCVALLNMSHEQLTHFKKLFSLQMRCAVVILCILCWFRNVCNERLFGLLAAAAAAAAANFFIRFLCIQFCVALTHLSFHLLNMVSYAICIAPNVCQTR